MDGTTFNTSDVHYLMNTETVCNCVARLHVDASAADVIAHVAPQLTGIENARPRDVAYFFAACVARHYSNRAAYCVAVRRGNARNCPRY